jgi:hypothetical protein
MTADEPKHIPIALFKFNDASGGVYFIEKILFEIQKPVLVGGVILVGAVGEKAPKRGIPILPLHNCVAKLYPFPLRDERDDVFGH